ncbi:uncharacterized protein [Onthophagus taurus]|uniref:uncharacterized protein n=1 Tax=Onthophagus taurus TaxID=166361 RepID=UPI000C208F87|nr:uncharacterized protein LOC111421383 [Onthophagus taurus]
MGNKLCKKKNEVDGNHPKSTPFIRIMSRFHLKPRWKSDSHLERKHVNRYEVPPLNGTLPQNQQKSISKTISKSSDWTEVSLEVPDDEVEMKNSKLVFSSDSTDGTPLPPPRKHKKGFKERIESVAKSGLQALQKKPVEEPLCVKKIINYSCPTDEEHERTHNRDHKLLPRIATPKINHKTTRDREAKRKKNLSVVSLPNYTDLKFSVASNGENIDVELRKSVHSLPGETKKLSTFTEKKDYITRCRSFGSSLPQLLLHKLTNNKAPLAEIESDDSFGGLEDWDLKIIEHYNPKDSSLPRNSKPIKSEAEILNDLESLIINEEDIENIKPKPKPPVRRSESLVKKINKTAVEVARKVSNTSNVKNGTPPPTPDEKSVEETIQISFENLPTQDEQGNVEHSSLLKILQDFSIKDAQEKQKNENNNIKETETRKNIKNIKNQDVNTNMHIQSGRKHNSFEVTNFLDAERNHLTFENNNRMKVVDIQS